MESFDLCRALVNFPPTRPSHYYGIIFNSQHDLTRLQLTAPQTAFDELNIQGDGQERKLVFFPSIKRFYTVIVDGNFNHITNMNGHIPQNLIEYFQAVRKSTKKNKNINLHICSN